MSKEAFEAWHKDKYRGLNYKIMPNGSYLHERVNLDYQIWQASYSSCEQHYRAQSEPVAVVSPITVGMSLNGIAEPEQTYQAIKVESALPVGAELFAHAMPKSDKPVFGKLFSETIGEYSPTVLGKFDSFASDIIKILVDIHAGTEIADCIAGLTWRLSIVEQRDEILSKKVIELSTPQPTTDISELVKDGFDILVTEAKHEASHAMIKFPQPNYTLLKVAEEAGEVIKAGVHLAEGRDTAEHVRQEMKQTIAMIYRVWIEGDQRNGVPSINDLINAGKAHHASLP